MPIRMEIILIDKWNKRIRLVCLWLRMGLHSHLLDLLEIDVENTKQCYFSQLNSFIWNCWSKRILKIKICNPLCTYWFLSVCLWVMDLCSCAMSIIKSTAGHWGHIFTPYCNILQFVGSSVVVILIKGHYFDYKTFIVSWVFGIKGKKTRNGGRMAHEE